MTLVLHRWIVDLPGDVDPRNSVVEDVIPALERSGARRGEDPYYVSRQWDPLSRSEAWLTLVVGEGSLVPDLIDVELAGVERFDTATDRILHDDAAWYRSALREVTDIAIEVIASGTPLPVTEMDFIGGEAGAVTLLVETLRVTSPSFRDVCVSEEAAESFFTRFLRPGPDDLSRPGHWLWNIAG